MSGLAPLDHRDDRTLPPLHSLFGPPLPRSSQLSLTQPQAFPHRTPSPRHFSGILRPANSLHNLSTYQPPSRPAQPPPPSTSSSASSSVRDLPALDKVHISAPPPVSHLSAQPTQNIFSSSHAFRPAPASVASRYPGFLHDRTASTSTATTTTTANSDLHSNRSSAAFSSSNATSITDYSSVRSSTISRSSAKIVGVQEIPGEGECYVYEDGSYMRAVIGGERVNPAWGITKAGKPRKRLAKACMTCREKKIKCEQGEPGDSRCGQCARTNRVCRVPQETRASPEPETVRTSAHTPAPTPQRSEDHLVLTEGLHDSSVRKRTHDMLHVAPSPEEHHSPVHTPARTPIESTDHGPNVRGDKTRNFFFDLAAPATGPQGPVARRRTKQCSKGRQFSAPLPPQKIDTSRFTEDTDPYVVDPETTIYYLELFFYYRNRGPYTAVPRKQFLKWVRASRDKSADDLMAVYAFMAFGARFSIEDDLKECGRVFHKFAIQLERQRTTAYTLQLIHARSVLLFYGFSDGDFEAAFEYTANAVRALSMLRYQDENVITSVPDEKGTYEYGMPARQLIECRRRTFWIVYMVDRFNSFSFGSMGLIRDVEVFMRMPCADEDFYNGVVTNMPHFNADGIHDPYPAEAGDMAYLVDIVSVWGHVTAHAYSSINRDPNVYKVSYEKYFDQTCAEMRAWSDRLPSALRLSKENTAAALAKGYFSQYYTTQAIYCLIGMKLGRIGRVELLSDEIKRRNLRIALYHARVLLDMIMVLSRAIYANPGEDVDLAYSQPFPGYCITNAVDILSSGGKASSLAAMTNNELEAAKSVVEQKSNFWIISKKQQQLIDDRQGLLSAYGISGGSEKDKHRVPEAIDRSFLPAGHDMVYEIADDIFFDVVLDEASWHTDPLGIL